MITSFLLPLLAIVLLCAGWAVFQLWLSRQDPDAKTDALECGGCGRREECGTGRDRR